MNPYVILRNGNVTDDLRTEPLPLAGDNVLSFVVVMMTNSTMTVRLAWSNDMLNWKVVQTWTSVGFGANALSPVTGLVAGFIQLWLTANDLPSNLIVPTITMLSYPRDQVPMTSTPIPPAPVG
mgnify:CR=1 FL=1